MGIGDIVEGNKMTSKQVVQVPCVVVFDEYDNDDGSISYQAEAYICGQRIVQTRILRSKKACIGEIKRKIKSYYE